MAEKIRSGSTQLLEAVSKIESDYFINQIDQSTVFHLLQDINENLEEFLMIVSSENDTKNMISLLLILERFKKNLIFESSVISMCENEFQTLFLNLEKATAYSNDNERSYEFNDDTLDDNCSEKNFDAKEYDYFNSKPKNKRANYPKKISRILKNWLKENMNNPYPSESEKIMLIEHTGLDATQINNWFINARRRILPFMKSKYIKYD